MARKISFYYFEDGGGGGGIVGGSPTVVAGVYANFICVSTNLTARSSLI